MFKIRIMKIQIKIVLGSCKMIKIFVKDVLEDFILMKILFVKKLVIYVLLTTNKTETVLLASQVMNE